MLYLVKLVTKVNHYKYHVFHFRSFLGWGGAGRRPCLPLSSPADLPQVPWLMLVNLPLYCHAQEFLASHFHSTAVSLNMLESTDHCPGFRGKLERSGTGQEVSCPGLLGLWVFLPSLSLSSVTPRWVREFPVFLESWDLLVSRLSCVWALLLSEVVCVTYTQQCELCLLETQCFLLLWSLKGLYLLNNFLFLQMSMI